MKITERNAQEIGKSLLVSLPKGWSKSMNIKKGDPVKMMVSENGNLTISPEFTKKEEKKEASIIFEQDFRRRFIREYFEGNEKISITFNKEIKENELKDIYVFLKRFMNIQIVDESKKQIVLKIFRIDELSILECLSRMHSLSLSMLECIYSSSNKTKIKELRDNMTRFYNMLVMQIRRFLSEGKYTDENQISLIRAMDIRMVAEKVQRVGEILSGFSTKEDKTLKMLKEIDTYYSQATKYFIEENFNKALLLWKKAEEIKTACEKLALNEKDKTLLLNLIRYSKEISMLVR